MTPFQNRTHRVRAGQVPVRRGHTAVSIRVAVLCLIVVVLAAYAWRNWFVSLCGLIVLTAFMGHPDMPRTLFGVQGLNLWNLLLFAILVPWYCERRQSGRRWDLPRGAKWLLLIYLSVVIVAYARAALDLGSFPSDAEGAASRMTFAQLTGDHLINSIKFIIPGLLLFDGCRTRNRVIAGLICSLLMSVVYAGIVVRTVPVGSLDETGRAEMRQRHRIGKQTGFHANSVAMVCAAGAWGLIAASTVWKWRLKQVIVVGLALLVATGLILTRSRAGYAAVVCVGLLLALVLWRSLLVLVPVAVAIVIVAFPGVSQRVMAGVGVEDVSGGANDIDTITAGRVTDIWPPVLEQIAQSPVVGYGRMGILRTPAHDEVMIRMRQDRCPTHPHNAYLEILLDGGVVSAAPTLVMYVALLWVSIRLCRVREALVRAVGASSLAAVSALLLMGMSGQTFFPKENSQMAWCLYGLALRGWRAVQPAGVRAEGGTR